MLRFVLRRAQYPFLVGAVGVIGLLLLLPAALELRVWWTAAVLLLSPWLVLGRDAVRQAEGWRDTVSRAPRAGWLVLAELVPALLLVGVVAGVGARFTAAPTLTLFAWGAALVTLSDALDRRTGRAGIAWVVVAGGGVLIGTAPLWLAPWFGEAPWSPWLASGAVALHPVGATLAAAGLPTLQDPIFYSISLSGVVEARPMSWVWGAGFFGALACLGAVAAVNAARRIPIFFSALGR